MEVEVDMMDFSHQVERRLMEQLTNADVKVFQGKLLFHLEHIRQMVDWDDLEPADDLVIEVYYVHSGRRTELYEYSLSLRVVELVQPKEVYFLAVTEKQRIGDISKEIIEVLDNTYYEVQRGDKPGFIACIRRYVQFMSERELNILGQLNADGELPKGDGIYYAFL